MASKHTPLLSPSTPSSTRTSDVGHIDVGQSLRPKRKFVYPFPASLDERFRTCDDALIRAIQHCPSRFFSKLAEFFSLFITFFTCVEWIMALPYILMFLGRDTMGTRTMFLALMLAFFSQIPKRFVWRPRPWMTGRAIKLRNDKTSSFPSRAVTCAIVYGFIIAEAIHDSDATHWGLVIPYCAVFALCASFARIHLGAHYPSDCIIGIMQGSVVVALSTLSFDSFTDTCSSCDSDACYAVAGRIISSSNLNHVDWPLLFLSSGGVMLSALLFMTKPIVFWEKSMLAFGLIGPCIVFRIVFLCPTDAHNWALHKPIFEAGGIPLVIVVAVLVTALSKTIKKWKWFSCLLIFVVDLFILCLWRLSTSG